MKLDRLVIAGFFHFKESARIEFSELPYGLIALVGPNGHGKTRLLDAGLACLYGPDGGSRAFPSRDGRLADYATSKDAYIETSWSLTGVGAFTARVNVDGVRRVTDAVLTSCGVPLNDGKATTFREAVDARFPSKRSVLCSAFAAQSKAGSFVELGQKERLELFAELADLSHYAVKAETAKRCAEAVGAAVEKLATTLAVLEPETSDAREAELKGKALLRQEELRLLEGERDAVAATIGGLVEGRKAVEAQARECAVAEAEARNIGQRAERVQQELLRLAADTAQALAVHERTVKDLKERIAGNQTLVAQAETIRAQAAEKARVEAELAVLREQERMTNADRELVLVSLRDVESKLAAIARKQQRLLDAKQQAEIVQTVPCKGEAPFDGCRFLGLAAEARETIATLEADIAGERALVVEHKDLVARLTAADERRTAHVAAVKLLEMTLATLTLARYAPELALVEERVAGYKQKLTDEDAAFDAVLTKSEAQVDTLSVESVDLASRLAVAQETVARLSPSHGKLQSIDDVLATKRAELSQIEKALGQVEAALEAVFQAQAQLETKRQVAVEAKRRQDLAAREQLAWATLARACGRDGLPKLEIDAAGPTVSAYCNELLAGAFGTRFALEVVTQLPTADGKGVKEGFTIQVLDNAHGAEPRDIADLSGGERVIVEEALRAALACYVNSRNRQPVETLWRDETTGALDPANAPRYVAMLRTLVRLAGARQCLFVTHAPECAALADAQIVVENGQPTVRLPPYEEGA